MGCVPNKKGGVMKGLITAVLILASGCAVPLLNERTAVTKIAIGNSSIRGELKTEYRALWDLCMNKLDAMDAKGIKINESKGIIKASVANTDLRIKIDSLKPQTQRLFISTMKYLMPKPEFAQKIFFEIADEFK